MTPWRPDPHQCVSIARHRLRQQALETVCSRDADEQRVHEPGAVGDGDAVDVVSLIDDIHGNLDGQGTCAVSQYLAPGAFYECSFSAVVTGNAGDSETDTVTAEAQDNDGNTVDASDSATVTILDVTPAIEVTKTPAPSTLDEPGGPVTFTVRIDSLSTAAAVTLDALVDDVFGGSSDKY